MPRTIPLGRPAAGLLASLALAGCAAAQSPSPSAASPAASSAAPSASASAVASASGGASPGGSAAEADVTVSGVEYAFEDLPESVDAGTVLGFQNEGQEVHEMTVFRVNDDVISRGARRRRERTPR